MEKKRRLRVHSRSSSSSSSSSSKRTRISLSKALLVLVALSAVSFSNGLSTIERRQQQKYNHHRTYLSVYSTHHHQHHNAPLIMSNCSSSNQHKLFTHDHRLHSYPITTTNRFRLSSSRQSQRRRFDTKLQCTESPQDSLSSSSSSSLTSQPLSSSAVSSAQEKDDEEESSYSSSSATSSSLLDLGSPISEIYDNEGDYDDHENHDENDDDADDDGNNSNTNYCQPYHNHHHHNDGGLSPRFSVMYSRDPAALHNATHEFLYNHETYPLGKLSEEGMEAMTGLMAAWARKRSLQAALTVEALLKRIIDDLKAGNTDIHVRTQHYVLTIDAWSKSGAAGASERAQNIHDTMKAEYEQTGNRDIRPNVLSYTTLANAWAKGNETRAPQMAEQILQDMIRAFRQEGDVDMKPDAVTFSTIMDAYSRSPGVTGQAACRRCEELFGLMDELGVRKNVYTFSSLQNVYARSSLEMPHALERTMEILRHMQKLYEAGDVFAKPNARNYNAVLNAASRQRTEKAAKLAREILIKMEQPVDEGGYDVEPNRVSYLLTILACSRIPNKTLSVEMALDTLERMERRACQEEERRIQVSSAAPPTVRLDAEVFNIVLTKMSRLNTTNAPNQVRRLLRKMNEYAANDQPQVQPNVRSWNALLNSLSRVHLKSDAGAQAYGVLKHMYRLHRQGVPRVKPNAFSFAPVLTAYQRVATVASAEAADRLVSQMEDLYDKGELDRPPDVFHYTILAGCWAKSEQGKRGAERSMQILAHMLERQKAGFPDVTPNVRTYNAVMDCLARADEGDRVEQLLYHMLNLYRQGDDSAKPDAFSFTCAISAFTRSKTKGSGRRAEAILERFLEYQENENPSVLPDARSFTNIIAHYGRSRLMSGAGSAALDAPYRAEYIFNRMVVLFKEGRTYLEPNNFAVTTVMDSYSYAKHPDAGANAERLLRLVHTLREQYGAKHLSVNSFLINSVLFAWSMCGDPSAGSRAAPHFELMEREFANGNVDMRPNTATYTHLLRAISKSTGKDKAKKAFDVINRMKKQVNDGNTAVAVDEHHYSLAINACAFSNQDVENETEAFKIATTLFDELLESAELHPTSLTYGWFIQCCGRLRVPQFTSEVHIERAFHRCCDEGLVSQFVLKRLLGAAQEPLLRRLLKPAKMGGSFKPGRVTFGMLPYAWRSRTKGKS